MSEGLEGEAGRFTHLPLLRGVAGVPGLSCIVVVVRREATAFGPRERRFWVWEGGRGFQPFKGA